MDRQRIAWADNHRIAMRGSGVRRSIMKGAPRGDAVVVELGGAPMPLFHFTLHAYRSWNTDDPRGYVKRGERGIQLPDESLAAARDGLAKFPPVTFDVSDQQFLTAEAREVVQRRGWRLLGVTTIETHLHLVVGWDGTVDEGDAQAQLKRGFGFVLARRQGTKGRPYFSRGGVPERVKDKKHLRYLLYEYFPGHHGAMWRVELE